MRRSGAASRRAQCVRLPLRGQHRLARLRCSQAPCFPFNCARRRARASTETRASVGGAGGSVKANRGAGCGRHVPVARSRRSRPASSKRPAASISIAIPMPAHAAARNLPAGDDRSACVCAGALCYRMRRVRCPRRPPAGAVKRETGGGHPPGLCCPRNGTPPARRAFSARAHAAHDATARLLRVGRPRPGKRPARIPADARGERCARRTPGPRGTDCVRVLCAYGALMVRSRPLRAGCFHSAMHCHSAGRLRATRSPLFPSSPRFAPCRPR